MVGGLAIGGTLGGGPLAATTADANPVDDITLLGLVSEAASLIGAGRAGRAVDDVQGTVLPASDTEKEAEDICGAGLDVRTTGSTIATGTWRTEN